MLFILRWILGYVSFEIKGKYPERFLNIVTKNGLSIWSAQKNVDTITACMFVRDYKHIRGLCKKSAVVLKISKKHGLPFFVQSHKQRVGVVIGALLFCLIIVFMSQFVWTIQVSGLKTISHTQLMDTLEKNGLHIGTYKDAVSFQAISRSTMYEIDDIGWMAINVTGCHASVEIKEKHKSPYVADISKPANVKAKCDGFITQIDVKSGHSYFKSGSAVVKDQLLVGAVIEDQTGGVTLVRADARIIADTVHKKEFVIKRKQTYHSFEHYADIKSAFAFNFDFVYKTTFINKDECTALKDTYNLKIFDTALPLGLKTSRLYKKTEKTTELTDSVAQQLFIKKSMLYRLFCLADCQIKEVVVEQNHKDSSYVFCATYSCTEDIAYQQEIDTKNLTIKKAEKSQKQN